MPNFFTRLNEKYFIVFAQIEPHTKTTMHSMYLRTNEKGKTDFTSDPKEATAFGLLMARMIYNRSIKHFSAPENSLSIVPVSDVLFIHNVLHSNHSGTSGPQTPKEELEELIFDNPKVYGIGTMYDKCPNGELAFIHVLVGDEEAKKFVESFLDNEFLFNGIPVEIEIGEMATPSIIIF